MTKTMFLITFAATALLSALSAGSGPARAATINLDRPNETGRAWVEQAREAEAKQDFERALYLFQRAAILPGSEEAGTVGMAHVQQIMGDSDKAAQALKDFIARINPFSLDAHLALADAYLAQDQQPKAEAELQIVQKLRPGYGPANERIGVIAFRKGNFRLAVSSLNKVLERNPTHAKALELRGRAYLKLEKFSSALADYKALQAIEPDDIEHYVSIGRIYIQLGELDVADRYLTAALSASEIAPSQRVRILVLAGNLEQSRGNDKKALAYFKRAYETNPQDLELGLKLSDMYASSRNFPQAQLTIDRIMEYSPGNDSAIKLALKISDLYVNTRNYSQAQQTLARVLTVSPGNEAAAKRMLELYSLLGRRDGLGVFLKNYVDNYPDKTWAAIAYSKLLTEIGDAAGAENTLRNVAKNGFPTPEIALALAKNLALQSRFEDAEPLLQKALEKFPKDDRLRFDLALCWEKLGEPKKARQEYEKITEANVEVHRKASINLIALYEKSGETQKALATLKRVQAGGTLAAGLQKKLETLGRSPASQPTEK